MFSTPMFAGGYFLSGYRYSKLASWKQVTSTDDVIDYIYTAMFLRDFPSWHHEDPANCLSTQLGGVFVEGGEEHFPRLRAQYALRENVKLMLEQSDPKSVRSF